MYKKLSAPEVSSSKKPRLFHPSYIFFDWFLLRLNHAVTDGRYERDVGRKTSFYIFFPESMSIRNALDKVSVMNFSSYTSNIIFSANEK